MISRAGPGRERPGIKKTSIFSWNAFKSIDFQSRAELGQAGDRESHRFLIRILLKSIDFERRGKVGRGRDSEDHHFSIKILLESIDLEGRAGSGEAGTLKIIIFQLKAFKEVSIIDSEEIEN